MKALSTRYTNRGIKVKSKGALRNARNRAVATHLLCYLFISVQRKDSDLVVRDCIDQLMNFTLIKLFKRETKNNLNYFTAFRLTLKEL